MTIDDDLTLTIKIDWDLELLHFFDKKNPENHMAIPFRVWIDINHTIKAYLGAHGEAN